MSRYNVPWLGFFQESLYFGALFRVAGLTGFPGWVDWLLRVG